MSIFAKPVKLKIFADRIFVEKFTHEDISDSGRVSSGSDDAFSIDRYVAEYQLVGIKKVTVTRNVTMEEFQQ